MTFTSKHTGEGTGSMPHIRRLFSKEGEPKHISTDMLPYLKSSFFPLASPPSAFTIKQLHIKNVTCNYVGEREQVTTNVPTTFENLLILLMQFIYNVIFLEVAHLH